MRPSLREKVERLQGYLAHKKTPNPLGPPQVPRHRDAVGSYGGGVYYERGTPVGSRSFRRGCACCFAPFHRPPTYAQILNHTTLWMRPILRDRDRDYKGTSLTRNSPPIAPYSRTVPRALLWSQGGGAMSEVPLDHAHPILRDRDRDYRGTSLIRQRPPP